MSAMRRFDAAERRARIGRRHALAPTTRAEDPVGATRSVVALHGTDPATTVLSACARMQAPSTEGVLSALYDDRSLVRVMAMRRTVFAVPRELAGTCLAGAGDVVAREQRRLVHRYLRDSGLTAGEEDTPRFVRLAERAVLRILGRDGELSAAALAGADRRLGRRVELGGGTSVTVASRLLTLMSAEGRVVRTRPSGSWTSTQFRWARTSDWVELGRLPGAATAAADLARSWLERFGPATEEDLQWWAGWTKTRTRAALSACGAVEVDLDGTPGIALPDDLEPTAPVDPWVALLPALDPTTMGWKHRGFYLGEHREQLFDVNGNAGPTVWADGRVVGGWAHRDDGAVALRVLEDVGTDVRVAIDAEAARLQAFLGDVRLKARARGWTPLERALRS